MSGIEVFGSKILDSRKYVTLVCIFALVATISLIMIRYYFTPLSVDGGWYSYPAFALSKDRDPMECLASVSELKNIQGVKSSFRVDDFRASIRIIPMSWWFKIIGSNIWAAKLYGIFELSILMGMAYLLLRQISENKNITLLCWAIFLTDGEAIALGSSNLRADIMYTFTALLVFLLICIEARKQRLLLFVFGVLSISFLVLIYLTSVIPLSFLISYIIVELFLSWKKLSNFKKRLYISLTLTGIIILILRPKIWDLLLPSQYITKSLFDTEKYIYSEFTIDISTWIAKEMHRWMNYFFMSNLVEFVAILLTLPLFVLCLPWLSKKKKLPSQMISIPIGCAAAIGVLTFLDPFRSSSAAHALPVVPFFVVILAMVLNIIPNQKQKHLGVTLLFIFVLLASGIRIAQGVDIMRKGILSGYTNNSVTETMNNVFDDEDRNYTVIGPTELWPYINQKTNVTILDRRSSRGIEDLKNHMESIDFIIINNDYQGYNWEERFRKRYPDVKLDTIAKVGKTNTGWHFLKIISTSLTVDNPDTVRHDD